MTIKQQGGIFGRNPTFNDITADGSVTVQGSNNPTVTIKGNANNQNTTPYGSIEFYNSDASAAGPNIAAGIKVIARNGTGSGGELAFFTSDGTQDEGVAASETVRVDGQGNIILQNSGAGIDFSATSGTGTSELFDDYEEGTWTPTLINFAGTPTVSGAYTKIGKMVYLECSIELDGTSDPSMYLIDNLPFSVASPYHGGGFLAYNNAGTTDIVIGIDSSSRLRIRNSSGAMRTYNSVGASSTIIINAQYRAA